MRNILISMPILIVIIIGTFAVDYIWFARNVGGISLGTEIKRDREEHAALLVFDVQEGLTGSYSKNEAYRQQSTQLIHRINQLIDTAGKTKIPVIYIRNNVSDYLVNLLNGSLAFDGPGVEPDKRLRIIPGYTIMRKKLDAFSNPLLDSILNRHMITRLYITGLDPAGSINNTLMAARNRNYSISLVEDAIISEHAQSKKKKLSEFSQNGCDLVSCNDCMMDFRK